MNIYFTTAAINNNNNNLVWKTYKEIINNVNQYSLPQKTCQLVDFAEN